jgi:hypothetical protein
MLLKYHSRYWLRFIAISTALILICICADSQNLVGYNGKAIMKYMKENHKEMNYNNVVNSKFSYLKYSDNLENSTILFFMNPDSVCRSERIICDISLMPAKVKEFNSQFVNIGEHRWTDKHAGKTYTIEIAEGKWSCVISIEPEK